MLHWCQKWDAQFDLPLPEITTEEFSRAWTRFKLVSTAKEWNTEKQVMILPTLLRGKLVDYYVELDEAIKACMKLLKTALMTRAGLIKDPLTAGKIFISRCQHANEKAEIFTNDLRKLFEQAYPDEDVTSGILLQCLLTGLHVPVSHQILLHGQPTTFEQAIKEAMEIEYTLNFETKAEPVKVTNAVSNHNPLRVPNVEMQLQKTPDQMMKHMESLEMKLQAGAEGASDAYYSSLVEDAAREN